MAIVASTQQLFVNDIEASRAQLSDDFKTSIQALISTLEGRSKMIYSIQTITSKFHFHKRRLYDVLNVYESLGICKKLSVDSLLWIGFGNVFHTINCLAAQEHIFDESFNINVLSIPDSCITIANLTQKFMLLFNALHICTMDIKQCATFLSNKNDKYKTTLCKLYQITYILESSNIIFKSQKPGEVVISDQYLIHHDFESKSPVSIFSIQSLLNHQSESDLYEKRRRIFEFSTLSEKQKYFSLLAHRSFV